MKKIIICLSALAVVFSLYLLNQTPTEKPLPATQQATNETMPEETSKLLAILAIQDLESRHHQLTQFFTTTMSENAIQVLGLVSQLESSEHRDICYATALSIWFDIDENALISWLEEHAPGPDLDRALIGLYSNTDISFEYRATFAKQLADTAQAQEALSDVLSNWAKQAPEAAIAWTINDSSDNQSLLAQIFEEVTTSSPELAIDSLSLLESSDSELVSIAIASIASVFDPDMLNTSTMLSIQSLAPYEFKEELISALLPALFKFENISIDNLTALIDSLLPGETQNRLQQDMAFNWAFKNPTDAAQYAELQTGEARELTVNAVISSWLQTDLVAADEWLSSLDGNLDLAANTLGRGSASQGNIEISNTWLNKIENEELRAQAVVDVVAEQYQKDPVIGIYQLVHHDGISVQKKLEMLHRIYPDEIFTSPFQALDDIGRLEGLRSAF